MMDGCRRMKNPSNAVLYWASRRGMLELDLLLVPYVRDRASQLSATDRERLWELLQEDDTWLLERLVYSREHKDDRHRIMLERILEYVDST